MSKGIFVRLSEEAYDRLNKEAENKKLSLYKLVKEILEEYSKGRLKVITPQEEAMLRTRAELAPIKEKLKILESDLHELKGFIEEVRREVSTFKQFIDQVLVVEQRLRSLEARIGNLEKELKAR
ncbi:MAG: hypothetical protein ACTSUJ_08020 [Candidatus Njordarchaeales archaeon]